MWHMLPHVLASSDRAGTLPNVGHAAIERGSFFTKFSHVVFFDKPLAEVVFSSKISSKGRQGVQDV
jgi:hypothetical protein